MSSADDDEATESGESTGSPGEAKTGWLARLPRCQFTLRTLLLVVTGVAVFCALCAWLGVLVWIVLAAAVGAFVGLLVGICVGLDTQIDDVRVDLMRCLVAAACLVIPSSLMIRAGLGGYGLVAPVVVSGFIVKVLWRDFVGTEIVLVEASMLMAIAVGASLVRAVLGL